MELLQTQLLITQFKHESNDSIVSQAVGPMPKSDKHAESALRYFANVIENIDSDCRRGGVKTNSSECNSACLRRAWT